MVLACQDGLCYDDHVFSVTINGLKNRYSTYRGALPYEEVFVETYDTTGENKVDFSSPAAFEGELEPGTVEIKPDSFAISERGVGMPTDFSFELSYAGLQTFAGDTVSLGILDVSGFSGEIFQHSGSARVKANGMTFMGSLISKNANDYITTVTSQIPQTSDSVRITLSRVTNLGRVRPLSAQFEIIVSD